MDIPALRAELIAGHPDTGAYNVDDAVAATELNTLNRDVVRALTMTELREWASVNARAFNLRNAITTGSTDQVKSLAVIGDTMLGTDDAKLDPSNATHVALVNELVTDSVWSAADKTALVTKATDTLSRAQELGLGTVKPGHVENARV